MSRTTSLLLSTLLLTGCATATPDTTPAPPPTTEETMTLTEATEEIQQYLTLAQNTVPGEWELILDSRGWCAFRDGAEGRHHSLGLFGSAPVGTRQEAAERVAALWREAGIPVQAAEISGVQYRDTNTGMYIQFRAFDDRTSVLAESRCTPEEPTP